MVMESNNVTSLSYDLQASVAFDETSDNAVQLIEQGAPSNIVVSLRGASDSSDTENPVGFFDLDVNSDEFELDAEIRSVSNVLYAKLGRVPDLGPALPIDLGLFLNTWFKIDLTEAGVKMNDDLGADLMNSGVIVATQSYADTNIDGVKTGHYGFDVDKKKIVDLVETSSEEFKEAGLPAVSDGELLDFKNLLDMIDIKNAEIWIGKEDFLPYKIIADIDIKDGNKGILGTANIELIMGDFNDPVAVTEPADAVPIAEMLLGGLAPTLQE